MFSPRITASRKGQAAAAILFLVTTLIMPESLFALQVDVEEIKKARRVDFTNYRGKLSKRETVEQIKSIGRRLARQGNNKPIRFYMKYSLTHAVSKQEPEKLSADIFSIDRDAKVGHIKNIRRILQGYLENMYGYSTRDARVLAIFITYYNAVYRGNMKYFTAMYKKVVTKNITTGNAGLDTTWYRWPGRTKIIIPLTEDASRGKIDAIDPDIISDDRTKDEIRKDPDRISDRKDMTDIKQRVIERDKKELDREKEELDREKEEAAEEKKEIAEEKDQLEDEKDKAAERERELEEEKEEAETISDPEKRQEKEKEIAKKIEELEEDKEDIRQKEREIQKKEEKSRDRDKEIETKEKDVEDKEKEIARREKNLEEEKKEIEKDELKRDIEEEPKDAREKLIAREKELDEREDKLRDEELDKNIYGLKLYYLKIKEYLKGGHYNNELLMIDASSRKVLFTSPVKNICGRRYDIFSGGIVVITHRGEHTSGHRLTLVNRETLKEIKTGSDNIFWRSFVEVRGDNIYAILYDDGKYYLGKFDTELNLEAQSDVMIHEDTFISIFQDFIYINRKDKKIIVLKKEDLSYIDEVKPE